MKYMLDTNICIYLIKKKPQAVIERLEQTDISQVCISSITLSELEYGVSKSMRPVQNKMVLFEFLTPVEVAYYNDVAAQKYGALRALLEKRGAPIGSMDTLIAAHALSLESILVTNNEREFGRIPELKVENWANPSA